MFGKKDADARFQQAIETSVRLMLLAENGEKLYSHMLEWTNSSSVGDPKDIHELRHVIQVN